MRKYTFLLPAYKGKYFEDTLLSIKRQTYKNFKVIVSDDHSPDDIQCIFYKICGGDNRFSYRRNEQNIGGDNLAKHWNMLVDVCDTEYCIMASDDDVYAPMFLQEIDNLIDKYPEANMLRARAQRINGSDEVTAVDAIAPEYENQVDALYGFFNLKRIHCLANFVFKTDILKEKGSFERFPLAWGSDETAYMKMSTNGVCNTPSVVFSFRISDINISGRANTKQLALRAQARIENLVYFEDFIRNIKSDGSLLSKNRIQEFSHLYKESWLKQIRDGMEFSNWEQFKKCYKFLCAKQAIKGKIDALQLFYIWYRARKVRK